jgi:hypothetical protein
MKVQMMKDWLLTWNSLSRLPRSLFYRGSRLFSLGQGISGSIEKNEWCCDIYERFDWFRIEPFDWSKLAFRKQSCIKNHKGKVGTGRQRVGWTSYTTLRGIH